MALEQREREFEPQIRCWILLVLAIFGIVRALRITLFWELLSNTLFRITMSERFQVEDLNWVNRRFFKAVYKAFWAFAQMRRVRNKCSARPSRTLGIRHANGWNGWNFHLKAIKKLSQANSLKPFRAALKAPGCTEDPNWFPYKMLWFTSLWSLTFDGIISAKRCCWPRS